MRSSKVIDTQTEHILLPVLLMLSSVMVIALIHFAHEYWQLQKPEIARHYDFSDTSRFERRSDYERYLRHLIGGILLLLAVHLIALLARKRWLVLITLGLSVGLLFWF